VKHRNNNHHRRACGFALTEVLIAVGLLAIFMFVAAQVFGSTMKILRTDATNDDLTRSIDNAVAQLRRDVWTATELGVLDEALTLSSPDGKVIWSIDSTNHRLSRAVGSKDNAAARQSWPIAAATIRFEVAAQTLRATITPAPGARPATETFTSQIVLARGQS